MNKKGHSGFTLLELMIGLALLGLILVLLFSALRLGSRSWDAGENKLAIASSQTVVAGYLRRSLSQAFPLQFKRVEGPVLAFEGEADSMRYAGPIPTKLGVPGLHLVSLEFVEGELQLRWMLPDVETEDFSELSQAESARLVDGVKSVEIAYFGAQEPDAQPTWHDRWASNQNMPSLIRLTITPIKGMPWPEIVVPTMLNSTNCRWDDFYKRCMDQPRSPAASKMGGP